MKTEINVNIDEYNCINFLNKALQLEYNSIFDYQTYAAAIDDHTLKETLSGFGLMEMEHAKLLSEKIVSLGGAPLFNPPEIRKEKTLTIEDMLNEHKQGEVQAIDLLEKGLKMISDPELNWFIGQLKLDETDHLKEIEKILAEYEDLKRITTISRKVKWHDDYAGDDKERPWIE